MRTPRKRFSGYIAAPLAVLVTLIGAGPLATGANDDPKTTIVNFSQCANGSAPSTSTACPAGWIGSILHAPNSHYAEGQVVPQRLVLEVPAGVAATGHSVALKYQTRKGTTHAYDSLATWNHTQTTADACAGLDAADCPGGAASTAGFPDDTTSVPPATLGGTVTTPHMLSGAARRATMYGGSITNITAPAHDNAAGSGDDFATLTVVFEVSDTTVARKVMLLFGGHLAAALGANGWGSGLGSSSISGGPYHISIGAVDGESVGRRDNQIQGAAIFSPSISTIPLPDAGTVGVTIHDTAQLTGGSGSPSGTVTFKLFPPSDPTCAGTPVFTSTNPVVNGQATSGNYTTTVVGTYHWIAEYSGGEADLPAVHPCGEPVTTVIATPAIHTTQVPATTAVGGSIRDTASITGGFSVTGTVRFDLYGPDDPTCEGEPIYSDTGSVSNGAASSDSVAVTDVGTYQWVAHYLGDDNNDTADGACGDEPVAVSQASPSVATVPVPSAAKVGDAIHDTATVTGGYNPTGTVTFDLYGPATPTCEGGPVYSSTVALGTDGTATSGTYTPQSGGTYRWVATYNGDDDNRTAVGGCNDEKVSVSLVLANKTTTKTNTNTTSGTTSGTTLPRTGADVLPLVAAGWALLGVGTLLSLTPRKRRRRARES